MSILSQNSLDRLEHITEKAQQTIAGVNELQNGSLINRQDIKTFYLFANSKKPFAKFWQEKVQNKSVQVAEGNLAFIVESFSLPNLYKNNCDDVYCYQHRIPFSEIPSVFWKGLIGIEDTRFLEHSGIDYRALLRALLTDISKMKLVQGGSTLTQQLVKNLFLTNEKTILRKVKELIISIYIEKKYPKEKILEAYFNEVFWGVVQGIKVKGVYAAANFYFTKKINEISSYEAVILTAMLKGPNFYNPIKNIERLKNRVKVLFDKLVENNKVSRKYSGEWREQDWVNWQKKLRRENVSRGFYPIWHLSREEGPYLNSYERFVIVMKSQKILREITKKIGKKDIAIKIMIGNPYQKKNIYTYYSKIERNKEIALNKEKHQIGSTLKPVLYSVYNDLGKKFTDMVSTEKLTLHLKSGKWSPNEAHTISDKKVTLLRALEKSYNRPVIHLAQEVTFEKLQEKLTLFLPTIRKPLAEYPAQLLGALELSVAGLYEVYRKFIINECKKNRGENILFLLSDPTKTTIGKIVGEKLRKLQFFGKTGTSNNGLDNWFLFYEGSQLGVIWVGLESGRKDADLQLYGGNTSFRVFQDYFIERGKRFGELRCI